MDIDNAVPARFLQHCVGMLKRPTAIAAALIIMLLAPSVALADAGAPDIEGWHNLDMVWSKGTTIQSANSAYAEGESVPFQYTVTKGNPSGLTGGNVYRVVLKWEHLYGTGVPFKSFIDYLTSYDATEGSVGGQAFDGLACGPLLVDTIPIPSDYGNNEPVDVYLPAAAENPGAAQVFELCNVEVLDFSDYVSLTPSGNSIVRTLEITYKVIGSGDQDVGIAFGGHLAQGSYWGLGNGAGNLSGASPKVLINQSEACTLVSGNYNCTPGTSDYNIDINPNAITVPSTIIVEKITDPNTATDTFDFTGDAAGTIANGEQIVVTSLAAGTYDSTESVPSDWLLTSITCDDANSSGDVASATATFNVVAGQTVKCTFTNTKGTLPITVGYFLAEQDDDTISFTWQTATETGNAGFNLFAETDGGLVQINDELIPSTVIDSVEPTDYAYTTVTSATSFYIEDVSITGATDRLGPFILGTPAGFRTGDNPQFTPVIWLPMVLQ